MKQNTRIILVLVTWVLVLYLLLPFMIYGSSKIPFLYSVNVVTVWMPIMIVGACGACALLFILRNKFKSIIFLIVSSVVCSFLLGRLVELSVVKRCRNVSELINAGCSDINELKNENIFPYYVSRIDSEPPRIWIESKCILWWDICYTKQDGWFYID
jgi:hypothetical protein